MRKIMFLVFLSSMLIKPAAYGEDGLALDQAIRIALQQNPEILLAQKNMADAAGKRLQMEAIADPMLVFNHEGIAIRKNRDGIESEEMSLGVEQSLEFPGKRALREKIGRYGEEKAALELEKVRLLIGARVKKAYYKAVFHRRTLESLESASSLLDQFLENLLIKYRTGTASYSDVLRARAEKARLRNQIITEEQEQAAANAELNLLMRRKGDEPTRLATDISYLPLDKDLWAIKEELRVSSPTLKIGSLRRRQSETGLKLALMSRMPDFSLGLYFPSLRTSAWGFLVGLSLPLWRTRQKGEIMEAEAANEIALISAEKQELRIMSRLETAYSRVRASEEQVKIFELQLLKDMEDELALGISRYEYGKIEFFNLLDLYRTYASVRLEHLKSLYLYLVSLAELEVAGEDDTD